MITDRDDPRLADYLDLTAPTAGQGHERDDRFIIEGPVALSKLVVSGHQVRSVLTTPKHADRVRGIVGAIDAPVLVVTADLMAETVGFNLHRGILASAERRPLPTIDHLVESTTSRGGRVRLAVLEGLNDPENLGVVARSARAFGIAGLVLDPTCIDPYYRRTVRVSMGEILLLPVARATSWPADLDVLHDAGFESWAMTPDAAATSVWDTTPTERVAVMLGAEGPGLSRAALDAAHTRVRIPIDPAVDSLNVGHAAAITFATLSR